MIFATQNKQTQEIEFVKITEKKVEDSISLRYPLSFEEIQDLVKWLNKQ